MPRHRLTVVLSQAPGKHPAKRSLEESIVAALLMEPFSRDLSSRLRRARVLGRAEVARTFRRERGRRPAAARRELLALLAASTAWSMWEALRVHQGLSPGQARAAVRHLVAALLAADT